MLGGYSLWFSQFSSVAQSYLTLCNPMDCSVRGLPVHYQLPELKLESVMPSNHLIFCHTPFLLHSIFPSIKVFSNESILRIRGPKDWSFSISPSNEYSGLISFRIDWFDLLSVQGTQEFSPTPQFKSINSLVFSFLYGQILTFIRNY